MTTQINSKYLENYAKAYSETVCERFFTDRQFISGQDIVGLTSSVQVNFFVIKHLFELWQKELQKLKSNPYFDYRDISVHEALTQFMNVLSRRIRVEKGNFQPLLEEAVKKAVELATDPVSYYQSEIDQAPAKQINEYLRENKKYYKWHAQLINFLIDKAGFGQEASDYKKAIAANYQAVKDQLESVNLLLATLGDVKAFDLDAYLQNDSQTEAEAVAPSPKTEESASFFENLEEEEVKEAPQVEVETTPEPVVSTPKSPSTSGSIQVTQVRARFSAESYKGMKGIIGELSESLAINQRFMFRKELFEGNDDLLTHALKSLDACDSLEDAIELINNRYVSELGWEANSEPVDEFLSLVYRRFLD
jgi:hypothetical protein